MSEELSPGLRLLMKPGAVDPQQVQELTVSQARVKVDNPARVLLGLPVGVIRENLDDIVIWLRSLLLSRSSVEAAYEANPRPVVLRRLAHLAEDAGNERLAGILTDVVEAAQDVRIGRGQTGVGRSLVISSRLLDRPALERPWLERLENQISVAEEVVTDVLDSSSLERMPPNQTVQFARSAKEADAYHSTSMEGYRLRPEDVSVLLGGSPRNALTEDEIRTRMAIAGYSKAFDGLLVRFESDGEVRITQNLILDLYADLWSPSVEAGLVESGQLREWRNQQVYIRNSRYVPPAPERVGEMMAHFVDRMMALADHYVRGVLAHLFLVTIHPFPDGNGRIGRFLMNAAFLDGGIPWLTIPVEERNGYFAALQQAQLDNDAATFARFIDELRGSGALSSGTPAPPASR